MAEAEGQDGKYASHFVGAYLDRARRCMLRGRSDDPGFLFLSQRGNPFDRSSLNKCALHQVARLLPKRAGISGYTFRHSVASHLLANDVDITYIAKLLGHESLRTTQRYLRIEIGDLKRMHGLYHPRERVGRETNPNVTRCVTADAERGSSSPDDTVSRHDARTRAHTQPVHGRVANCDSRTARGSGHRR